MSKEGLKRGGAKERPRGGSFHTHTHTPQGRERKEQRLPARGRRSLQEPSLEREINEQKQFKRWCVSPHPKASPNWGGGHKRRLPSQRCFLVVQLVQSKNAGWRSRSPQNDGASCRTVSLLATTNPSELTASCPVGLDMLKSGPRTKALESRCPNATKGACGRFGI